MGSKLLTYGTIVDNPPREVALSKYFKDTAIYKNVNDEILLDD